MAYFVPPVSRGKGTSVRRDAALSIQTWNPAVSSAFCDLKTFFPPAAACFFFSSLKVCNHNNKTPCFIHRMSGRPKRSRTVLLPSTGVAAENGNMRALPKRFITSMRAERSAARWGWGGVTSSTLMLLFALLSQGPLFARSSLRGAHYTPAGVKNNCDGAT